MRRLLRQVVGVCRRWDDWFERIGIGRAEQIPLAALIVLAIVWTAFGLTGSRDYSGYWQSEGRIGDHESLLLRIDQRDDGYRIAGFRFLGSPTQRVGVEGGSLVVHGLTADGRGFRAAFACNPEGSRLLMTLFAPGKPGMTPPEVILRVGFVPAKGSKAELDARLATQF